MKKSKAIAAALSGSAIRVKGDEGYITKEEGQPFLHHMMYGQQLVMTVYRMDLEEREDNWEIVEERYNVGDTDSVTMRTSIHKDAMKMLVESDGKGFNLKLAKIIKSSWPKWSNNEY